MRNRFEIKIKEILLSSRVFFSQKLSNKNVCNLIYIAIISYLYIYN